MIGIGRRDPVLALMLYQVQLWYVCLWKTLQGAKKLSESGPGVSTHWASHYPQFGHVADVQK